VPDPKKEEKHEKIKTLIGRRKNKKWTIKKTEKINPPPKT
jgi:hypothetical protein